MSRESELMIGFALVIAMGCGVSNAAAQTDKYPDGSDRPIPDEKNAVFVYRVSALVDDLVVRRGTKRASIRFTASMENASAS